MAYRRCRRPGGRRAASIIANILRGKHKPSLPPCRFGDNVIVINADKVRFTSTQLEGQDLYRATANAAGISRCMRADQ